MNLSGHGIRAALPTGWEGAIVRQPGVDVAAARFHTQGLGDGGPGGGATAAAASSGASEVLHSRPVVHLANFALPSDRGDFGSGAVETMGANDVFLSLVEYGPENVGTALFADPGPPRRLDPAEFHPRALQRTLPRQAGYQAFFTAGHRPFCLYVVLGEMRNAVALVGAANAVLDGLEIGSS